MIFKNKYKDFFEEMVEKHHEELYRYAYRYAGDDVIAEDSVSDCFSEAWKSIHTLKKKESARAWLYQILRIQCYRWVKDKMKRNQLSLDNLEEHHEISEEDEAETFAKKDAIQYALNQLDEHYRSVFLLIYMEGMSTKEAANEMNLPQGTILTRIHRAKKMLKTHLSAYSNEYEKKKKSEPAIKPIQKEIS